MPEAGESSKKGATGKCWLMDINYRQMEGRSFEVLLYSRMMLDNNNTLNMIFKKLHERVMDVFIIKK